MAAPAVIVLDTPMVRSEIARSKAAPLPAPNQARMRQQALRQPFGSARLLHLDAERNRRRIEQHNAPVDAGIDVLPAHQSQHQEGADADQRDDAQSQLLR